MHFCMFSVTQSQFLFCGKLLCFCVGLFLSSLC